MRLMCGFDYSLLRRIFMFKGQKIIAVCIPRPYEATRFGYIEKLNAAAISRDYKLFVYQTNSDLFMNTSSDIGEEYVFDLIDYDVVDGIIIFTEMMDINLGFFSDIRQCSFNNILNNI